jgi:hypothetical protein
MASRALAVCARSPDDYAKVYALKRQRQEDRLERRRQAGIGRKKNS